MKVIKTSFVCIFFIILMCLFISSIASAQKTLVVAVKRKLTPPCR